MYTWNCFPVSQSFKANEQTWNSWVSCSKKLCNVSCVHHSQSKLMSTPHRRLEGQVLQTDLISTSHVMYERILVTSVMCKYVSVMLIGFCFKRYIRSIWNQTKYTTWLLNFLSFATDESGFCFTSSLLNENRLCFVFTATIHPPKLWRSSLAFWYTAGNSCNLLPVSWPPAEANRLNKLMVLPFYLTTSLFTSPLKIKPMWPPFYKQSSGLK